MKRFAVRMLIFLSPVFALMLFYVVTDPFKIIYHYPQYLHSGRDNYVIPNRDYSTIENLKNQGIGNYDSYMLGSSRCMFFPIKKWSEYINSSNVYHMNSFGESLYGIEKKVAYLCNEKAEIKNILLVMDKSVLGKIDNDSGHIAIKHPVTTGESWLAFHGEFIRQFVNKDFLVAYFDQLLTGKVNRFSRVLSDYNLTYIPKTNELRIASMDSARRVDKYAYYRDPKLVFKRQGNDEKTGDPIIYDDQKRLLISIKNNLAACGVKPKIIINPQYDMMRLNPKDIVYLDSLFGKENVHDFSGKNDITINRIHYYEQLHFLPYVGGYLLQRVYDATDTTSIDTYEKLFTATGSELGK